MAVSTFEGAEAQRRGGLGARMAAPGQSRSSLRQRRSTASGVVANRTCRAFQGGFGSNWYWGLKKCLPQCF